LTHDPYFGDAEMIRALSARQRAYTRMRRLSFWSAILLTFFVSIPLRLEGPTTDVSWLITMCERILDGEKAYIDIFETTPPVPLLLYMPGVILARLLFITPEAMTFAIAYAAAFGSLALSARILPDVASGEKTSWLILLPAAVILFVLPNDSFAQREYFAAAFTLPIFSIFVRHAEQNVWPPLADRLLAAMLAGITIAIKPPLFAIPGIAVAAYYWWRTRNLSFLVSSGLLAAGLVGLTLTAASLAAFPEYLGEITTLMRDIYVPVRSHPLSFLNDKACLGILSCFGLALVLRFEGKTPVTAVLALVIAAGFLASYFIQGKFFPYHTFPAALFGGIAAWILVYQKVFAKCATTPVTVARAVGVYALAVLGISISTLFIVGFDDGRPVMSNVSWAAKLDRPRALAVSPDISTAFPLARRIGAVWVDRIHSQWVARYTRHALLFGGLSEPDTRKFLHYHNLDLEWILRRIREAKPDIIIQDISPGHSWLISELTTLDPSYLHGYEVIAEESGIRVLGRRVEVHKSF
jgi:hypothetical protein